MSALFKKQKAETRKLRFGSYEKLAATYSRGSYTTTTIGPAMFDGRVRNGNGSGHCGIATKMLAHCHRGVAAASGCQK